MATMACAKLGRLIMAYHSTEPPTDVEWGELVTLYDEVLRDHGAAAVMIHSEGGGPNAAQRRQVELVRAGRPVRVAVMTDRAIVRGIVTALAWLNPGVRAFKQNDLTGALEYLEIPHAQRQGVTNLLAALKQPL